MVIIIITLIAPLLTILLYYDFNSILSSYQPYYLNVIKFSIFQAIISSIISVCMGILFAHLLFKHSYIHGINSLVNFLSFTFILPTIIIVLGIISIYGNSGYLNYILEFFDLNIYGILGIIIAHVLLNFPFVTRIIFQSLQDISHDEWSLAKHNGLEGFALFKTIEWPAIKKTLPTILTMVFILCFMSFAPVIIFGGGPNFSTLEISIYQALLFEYDFTKAINLAFIQIIICLVFLLIFLFQNRISFFTLSENRASVTNTYSIRYLPDYLLLILFIMFAFSPLVTIILDGMQSPKLLEIAFSKFFLIALTYTFIISVASGLLSIILTLGLLSFGKNIFIKNSLKRFVIFETYIYLLLVFSPVLISSGFFILFRQYLGILNPGLWIVILINAVFTIPLSYSLIKSSFYKIFFEQDFLTQSLGLKGLTRFILIEWPVIKIPVITAFVVTSIISTSDLVIISFFGTNNFSTLSLLMFRLMGSYQIQESQAVALLFLIYCFIYFVISYKLLTKLKMRIN